VLQRAAIAHWTHFLRTQSAGEIDNVATRSMPSMHLPRKPSGSVHASGDGVDADLEFTTRERFAADADNPKASGPTHDKQQGGVPGNATKKTPYLPSS
jgi:hypothetical protein